jgi:hypothetical protein
MATIKTRPTDADVAEFVGNVDGERRRADAQAVLAMMREITGEQPVMWGASIVGFGVTEYTTTAGTNDWFRIGFSPRKTSLTIYINEGFDAHQDLLDRLGPHTTSVSCLYIKDLRKVDHEVLRKLITASWEAS